MLTYTAFDRLVYAWKTENSPRLHSFEPFSLSQWLGSLRVSKQNLEQELRENLLNLDDRGKLHYLEEMCTQLDAVSDTIANLSTAKATNLRQALRHSKPFLHTDDYKRVVNSLTAQQQDVPSPQRNEAAALPFQNEAVQASFIEVYQLVTQRLAAAKQESASNTPTNKLQSKRKAQPVFTWNAGPKDLLDLILTLQEKNHLTINETDKRKLSQAITSLFQLSHTTGTPESEDWQIFRPYLATIQVEKSPNRTRTETHTKRAKKSLYKGIEPFQGQ